jgi:hypothetical protein
LQEVVPRNVKVNNEECCLPALSIPGDDLRREL